MRYDVNAILFDEPLTVIDPHMKWQLRTKLKELHRRFGHTMIYVTHDQTEAMTLGDRIVVMKDGIIQQVAEPRELYDNPVNTFVATFIGSPPMNLCAGRWEKSSRGWEFVAEAIRVGLTEAAAESKNAGREAGASGWIEKPVAANQLARLVRELLAR